MAQENVLNDPAKQLNQLHQKQTQEKLYLHTDRSSYVAGDQVWFNAYLVNATSHALIASQTIAYVELINQQKEIVLKRYVKVANGVGAGNFKIPFDQPKGEYVIRAYTRYMQNFDLEYFFTKKIKVLTIKDAQTYQAAKGLTEDTKNKKSTTVVKSPKTKFNLDMQFFPEGGQMLDNLANQVAFKAIDHTGKGVEVQGKIVDNQGKELTRFSSVKFGMGKFMFIPKPQQSYTAVITYQGKKYGFTLPEGKNIGHKMQVTSTDEYIQVMSQVSNGYSIEQSSVVAHVRGKVIGKHTYKQAAPGFVWRIPKKNLPSGIIHLTLFDANKVPQCERLVFVENPKDLQKVAITSKDTKFAHRKKAVFDLELKDAAGNPVQGQASLAIVRTDLETSQAKKMNIQNYMWLKSDLKGHIEHPEYYFNKENKNRHEVMDLLMMTQGWRRFKWNDMPQLALRPLKYEREGGFTIKGRLYKLYVEDKVISGKVQFTSQQNIQLAGEANTDKNGLFVLKDVPIEDTTNLVFTGVRLVKKKRKNKIKEKKTNIFVKLEDINVFPSAVPNNYFANASPTIINKDALLDRTHKINRINAVHGLEPEVMLLKEVKVTSSRPARILSKIHMNSTNTVDFTKLDVGIINSALSIFDVLQGRVAQLRVRGTFPYQSVSIRGGCPMLLLDDTPISNRFLSLIRVEDIAYVDVLSTSRAAIYGFRGFNGVLAVYTKDRAGIVEESNINGTVVNMFHPGYSKAREFYVPKYDVEKISKDQLDYRRILYWKPNVTLDKDGKAQVAFFTSDESANYRIEVEGMTQKGKVILGTYKFEVK
ncbi:hypothetical protein BKI52_24440 [marine bacterium AO1-C]|nr:hypothetical protein BKI52_24440 [marine bacterium AO1-C]